MNGVYLQNGCSVWRLLFLYSAALMVFLAGFAGLFIIVGCFVCSDWCLFYFMIPDSGMRREVICDYYITVLFDYITINTIF